MLNDFQLPSLQSRRFKSKVQQYHTKYVIHNLKDILSDGLPPLPSFLRNGYYNNLEWTVTNFPSTLQYLNYGTLYHIT